MMSSRPSPNTDLLINRDPELSHGHICQNLRNSYFGACDQLLFSHTNPWELDEALMHWGFPIGPCGLMDELGLARVVKGQDGNGSPIFPRMLAEGRIGKIGGVGFYRYPGGGGAVTDPLIEDLILEEAHFAKHPRRGLSDAELVQQMTQTLLTALKQHLRSGENRQDIYNIALNQLRLPTRLIQMI